MFKDVIAGFKHGPGDHRARRAKLISHVNSRAGGQVVYCSALLIHNSHGQRWMLG